jgi:DNA-binding beta-propeller fold protein YncE
VELIVNKAADGLSEYDATAGGRLPVFGNPRSGEAGLCSVFCRRLRVNGVKYLLTFLLLLPAISLDAQLHLIPKVLDLNRMRGDTQGNMPLPVRAVIDPWRGMLYVQSGEARFIAVIDPATGSRRADIPMPAGLNGNARLAAVEPIGARLLFTIDNSNDSGARIVAYDPIINDIGARVTLGACERLDIVPIASEGLIAVSTGRNHVLLLDAATLQAVDSLNAAGECAGIAVDSVREELYVMMKGPLPSYTVFSIQTHDKVRSLLFPVPGVFERIALDPETSRAFMIGQSGVQLVDEFGQPGYSVPIPGKPVAMAVSPRSHRLFILDSAGYGPAYARAGKLISLSFLDANYDSTLTGIDCRALALYEESNLLSLVASGASTIETRDVYSGAVMNTVTIAHTVEDIAVVPGNNHVFVANVFGSERAVTRVNMSGSGPFERVVTGPRPCALTACNDRGSVLVTHQFKISLAEVPADESVSTELYSYQVVTGATDVLPGIACKGSLAILLEPENRSFILYDLANGSVLRNERIPGFVLDSRHNDIPPLHAAFLQNTGQFAILITPQKRLLWYAGVTDTSVEIDLSMIDWNRIPTASHHILTAGTTAGEIYIGPYRLDVSSPATIQQELPDSTVLLGTRSNGVEYALETSDGGAVLLCYPENTVTGIVRYVLDGAPSPLAAVEFDAEDGRLLLGDSKTGKVLVYDITTVSGTDAPREVPSGLSVYPNPVSTGSGAVVTLRPGAMGSRHMELFVYDMLGTMRAAVGCSHETDNTCVFRVPSLPAGLYVCRVHACGVNYVAKLIVVK